MMMYRVALLGFSLAIASAPAHAGELFGGLYVHAVGTPLSLESSREGGFDVQLGYRGAGIAGTRLQPYLLGELNSRGDTSFAAVGLSYKFGDHFYIRPGLGLAIHNGSAADRDVSGRIALGSRLLFEPELGVGMRLAPRLTAEASLVHLSHGQLFGGQNPG
ncbi:MAG: acyloxyacyl hydrolase, partial [Sphingomonas sp.]|uniref:acyloxyacyl hydrolase n=1 Tax=Sphingomonas sp. TaxID=28214 RepID=UPI00185D9DF3